MNLLDFSTYKVNKLEKSQVKLELTVKKEVYEEYKNKAYTKLAPSVNLPGLDQAWLLRMFLKHT